MQYQVVSRNPKLPEALREYAKSRVSGIENYGQEFEEIEIILDLEHGQTLCEIILHPFRGDSFVARDRAHNSRTAVDSAAGKLERQVLKFKDKKSSSRRQG